MHDARRRSLLRPAVLAVSLLVSALGLELAARALVWWRAPPGMVFRDDLVYSFAPHAEVGGIKLNNLGCVGDELELGDAPSFRVLLLGGSTSFSQLYVDSVRSRLRERLGRPDVEVVSCGKPRYTSYINRVQLAELAPRYRPDVVVLYLGINDNIYNTFPWVDDLPDVGYLDWRDPATSIVADLVRYHLVAKRLRSRPDFGPDDLRSAAIFRANLEAMVTAARASGALPVLATFAVALPTADRDLEQQVRADEARMEHFWGRVDSTLLGVAAHNRVARELARSERLPLAPVAERIPRDRAHFLDLCHLTAAANRILGATIADAIVEGMGSRTSVGAGLDASAAASVDLSRDP